MTVDLYLSCQMIYNLIFRSSVFRKNFDVILLHYMLLHIQVIWGFGSASSVKVFVLDSLVNDMINKCTAWLNMNQNELFFNSGDIVNVFMGVIPSLSSHQLAPPSYGSRSILHDLQRDFQVRKQD